jgi:hypothetical protein
MTPAVQPGADQGHLGVEGVEQVLALVMAEAAPQELAPLAQQAAIPAEQFGIHRLELKHDAIQPMASESRLAAHQFQVEGTEPHTAERADQLVLPFEGSAVAAGLSASLAPEFELQKVASLIAAGSAHPGDGLAMADEITIRAGAVGAETAQQFHGLEQVRLPSPVGPDNQKPWRPQFEPHVPVVAELQQLQAMQPNGSGAACG